jgi:2-methylcitrate dehydratase PrpD
MTIAQELARRLVTTRYDALTPGAIAYAKIGLLDTVAVGIAGFDDDASVIARKVSGTESGPALVWGGAGRTTAFNAAFLNGIAANVLDYDDCTNNLGGHPSSPVLPALIALAEERHASGRDLLTAYVAGFELETALARGVNFHHYEKGWHPTATLGVFGAAAACAKLLALDEEQTTRALALCASLAAGVKSNLGSMGKPMHVGNCSRNGLLAALLAAEGFTGNAEALEHPQGFLEVFNGRGNYSVERLLEKWGTPWEIEMPGIAVKQYPCCLSTQAAVDLTIELVARHDVRPDAVKKIEASVPALRLKHTDRPQLRSALDAKLSIQYVLARALTDRTVSLPHFEGEAFRASDVARRMELVEAKPFDATTLAKLGESGAAIALELEDGRRISGTIRRPVGHEPGVPLPPDLHKAKFEACVARRLTPQQTAELYMRVQSFEDVADVQSFTACFETAPARSMRVGR